MEGLRAQTVQQAGDRDRLAVEHAATEERLNRRQQELDAREARLEAHRQSLEEQHARWQAEEAQARRDLEEQSDLIEARKAELAEEQAAWERRRDASSEASEDPGPSTGPAVSEERLDRHTRRPEPRQQSSAEDVLRRLGIMPDFSGDDEGPAAAPPAPDHSERPHGRAAEGPARTQSPGPEMPAPGASHEHEESIDSYMERLLARVRSEGGESRASSGGPEAEPVRATAPARRNRPTAAEPNPAPPTPGDSVEPLQGAARGREPVELSPRAVAPERTADLSAMRELANQSARTAIERHHRRKTASAVWAKFLVTTFSLAAGCGMLWVWGGRRDTHVALYAAVACFAVAGLWGLQYAVLAAKLLLRTVPAAARFAGPSPESGRAQGSGARGEPFGQLLEALEGRPDDADDPGTSAPQ